MDEYTARTRAWLDRRFRVQAEGIYYPNQPIYGFSKLREWLEEYARTYAILRVLDGLAFGSFLDVGAADGYTADLVGRLYGVPALAAEVSAEGARRGREIFGLSAVSADAHELPFATGSVDLVLLSEVLEHLSDPARALQEALRVARRYVVLTTPLAASAEEARRMAAGRDPGEPHAHLHAFTAPELARLIGRPARMGRARSKLAARLYDLIYDDGEGAAALREAGLAFLLATPGLSEQTRAHYRWALVERYRRRPGWVKCCGRRTVAGLLLLDHLCCRLLPGLSWDHLVVVPLAGDGGGEPARRRRRRPILPFLLGGAAKPRHRLPPEADQGAAGE